jgi:GNAT superfamily N-acetyltransferase
MSVLIRSAGLNDVPLLAQMNDRLVEDQGSINPFSLTELEHRFREWLQTGAYQIDVILEHEQIVGYAVYQQRNDYYYSDQQVVYLRQFYIERGHRRRGLGRAAFAALKQTRFPKGQAVTLDVVATNPGGQHFWLQLGFEPYFIAMKMQARAENDFQT